jgi:hypothetical protein
MKPFTPPSTGGHPASVDLAEVELKLAARDSYLLSLIKEALELLEANKTDLSYIDQDEYCQYCGKKWPEDSHICEYTILRDKMKEVLK